MSKKISKIKNLFLMVTAMLCSITHSDLYATHIVGTDMTFECLGNDFYQVDLIVRRDCINGADDAQFDDPAYVGIFDFRGNPLDYLGKFGMIEMPISQTDTIYPSRPACGYFGGEVCVTEARYVATVYLPFREGGYVLGYQRCCRNVTLNNIVEPLNTGNTSFVCLTETTLNTCNSSPAFQDWPEMVICVNEPVVFDHIAVDRDGDSLSYMLYTPHSGASEDRPKPVPPPGPSYDTIEWAAGYGLDNLLGGEPLRVDPKTGTVTATPNTVGQFLVGILVVEWRDGKVLSKVRRNFEYNVRACQDVADLDFEVPAVTCGGLTVTFNNTSGNNSRFTWNFNALSSDVEFQSTEESPTFTYPEDGFYTVTLSSTNPETDCEVSISKEIAVFNSELTFDFVGSATNCVDGKQTVRFFSTAIEPNEDLTIESYKWEILAGDITIPLFGNVVETEIDCMDSIKVSHTVTSTSGCTAQVMKMVALDDLISKPPIDLVGDTVRLCIGESIALFNSAPDGVVYTWSPTRDLTFSDDTLQNDPVASPSETTLYTVTATDGFNTAEADVLVIVDMFPEFDFGVDTIKICRSGGTIPTINGSEAFDYDWSPADQVNTSSPYSPSDPSLSPTGEGYFYVTVTNGACHIIDSVYVTPIGIDPVALDEALVITPEVTTNDDGTISIIVPVNWEELAEQFDIDSVYWTITTDSEMFNGSGMDISATFNPTSIATIRIFIVDTDGCTTKITRVIDLDIMPSITFVSKDTISVCLGDTSFIVSTPNSEWTYTWGPEEGLIFDDPNDRSNPRISPTESRYYYLTVSNGSASVTDSIYIQSIDDLINIEITSGEICSGVATVTAQNNSNEGETEYEWSLDPNFSTIIATGTTVDIPFESSPITIYVRAESSGFCGSNEASITLEQDDYGIVADVTPINTCINNEGSVSLIIPDSVDVNILWTASDNITTEDLTSPNIDVVPLDGLTEVTLIYQVTDSNGCVSTFTVVVPVSDELIVGIEGDSESCSTTTGTFFATANANINSVNLEWSLDPEFGAILSTADTVTADLGETGIIYLRGTAGACESNVAQHMLDMKDLQLEVDAPNRICLGDTADIDLIISDGSNYTITWDEADEIISPLSGPEVIIVAIGGKDTIVLTYTADDGEGCVFMDEVRIPYSAVIDPNPVANVECGTQNMNFMIDPFYQDGDIFWNFGVINGDSITSIVSNPTISFDTSGIFMATISSTMETCNFDPTDFFYEVPEILEITTDQDLDQIICGDSTLMLRAMSNGSVITWTDLDNIFLAVGDSVEVNVSGISTVIATVSDVYGCTMQLRFNISMYVFDGTTDAPTEPICAQGGELVINATDNTNSDLSYLWTSTTGIIGSADSSTVTVNPANAEDLVLTVTNNAFNNCSEEISVPISLGTIDAIINSSEGTELDFGESTTLTVTPVGDNFSYVWEDESTDPSRIIMPEAGTTTTYTVTVTDNDTGCIGEASITITVATPLCADDESVFLPTAFSPNNDGQNDILMVRGNGLESVDLQVMDRWGKEVYRGGLLAEGWNGRHKNIGKELSPDVFAFALRAVCEDGTEILRRGHINLIR